jgi:hypothetical protein
MLYRKKFWMSGNLGKELPVLCVGFFPHEECDSDKSVLKMASYLRLILKNPIKF